MSLFFSAFLKASSEGIAQNKQHVRVSPTMRRAPKTIDTISTIVKWSTIQVSCRRYKSRLLSSYQGITTTGDIWILDLCFLTDGGIVRLNHATAMKMLHNPGFSAVVGLVPSLRVRNKKGTKEPCSIISSVFQKPANANTPHTAKPITSSNTKVK